MDVLTRFRRREKEKPAIPVYKSKEQCIEEIWAKSGQIIKVSLIKKIGNGNFYAVYNEKNETLFLITKKAYEDLK